MTEERTPKTDSKSPLRVLHIINSLARGGAETQLCYLVAYLQDCGWDIHIAYMGIVPSSEQNLDRLSRAGVTLHQLEPAGNYDPRTVLRLRRLIARIEPDVVQTWLPMMDVMGGLAAFSAGRPWILSERNADPPETDNVKMKIRRALARYATAIIANSESGIRLWDGLRDKGVTCRVVRNSLPHSELQNIRAMSPEQCASHLGVSDEKPLIVYAGRLESQKNIENLLYSLERVVAEKDARALLFGRGPMADMIQNFINERQLEQSIMLMGFHEDLWTWIRSADVFVSVSHYEGMPNTVMEAMALGRPIVVSDIGQHREICDESMGLLVDRNSPTAISAAIIQCLDDPEEAFIRGARAQAHAESWSIANAANEYAQIYWKAVDSGEEGHVL